MLEFQANFSKGEGGEDSRFEAVNNPVLVYIATAVNHYSAIWRMVPYLEEAEERRREKIDQLSLQEQKDLGVASFCPTASKRRKIDIEMSEDGVLELFVKFSRKEYSNDRTPKSVLLEHARRLRLKPPVYNTVSVCVCVCGGRDREVCSTV